MYLSSQIPKSDQYSTLVPNISPEQETEQVDCMKLCGSFHITPEP